MSRHKWLNVALGAALLADCGGGGDGGNNPPASSMGHVTYSLPDGDQYRIEAKAGATPQNVSSALNSLSAGADEWINTSPDGAWLLLGTERFDADCAGYACLAIVKGDLSSGEAIKIAGQVIHATGYSAVASGGNLVVYEDAGISHARDLWVVTRSGTTWGTPVDVTTGSPYDFNSHPSLSENGTKIGFDCGDVPYGGQGTAICEVNTSGSGLRVAVTLTSSPPGMPDVGALHHAAYGKDASIVFEADWAGEQIWRLSSGATTPTQVAPQVTNDNSPCVLPDGRIASLWLSRAGNPAGLHELKVMDADGTNDIMLVINTDVADIGISCGS